MKIKRCAYATWVLETSPQKKFPKGKALSEEGVFGRGAEIGLREKKRDYVVVCGSKTNLCDGKFWGNKA